MPAGRGPEKQDCVAARIAGMRPHATGPLTVHRLDMGTSGLMVFALDPDAHRALSRQFEARTVEIELPCGATVKVSANADCLREVFAVLLSLEATDA